MNLQVQTSWQAHFVNLEAHHFVAGAALCEPRNLFCGRRITVLNLNFQSADYTSELTRERMKQCEDHSWSKEARGKDKACLFSRRLVHITLDRWFDKSNDLVPTTHAA